MKTYKKMMSELPSRFWSKVEKGEYCWEWQAGFSEVGKGRFYGSFGFNGKTHHAHRMAYFIAKGPIPHGLHIDHLCRNTKCVNPDHLEAVTHAENIRRGLAPWTIAQFHRSKTHCAKGHPYDEKNTKKTKRGYRKCRTCDRLATMVCYYKSKASKS